MGSKIQTGRDILLLIIILFLSDNIHTQSSCTHQLGVEGWPGYIFPTGSFLWGGNNIHKRLGSAYSAHLKYSFQLQPGSTTDRIYRSSYQGIGLGYFNFGNDKEIGTSIALYASQEACIAELTPRLSLDYEWEFEASFSWKPYNYLNDPSNTIIGTKINAYLSVGIHLNWILPPLLDLNTGAVAVYFSNGNTRYPNTGLNTVDFRIGIIYNFNRNINDVLQPS